MRISEKLFDHKRKADASMPVAAGNECSGGGANSVTPTNKKAHHKMGFFFWLWSENENQRKAVRPQTKGRRKYAGCRRVHRQSWGHSKSG